MLSLIPAVHFELGVYPPDARGVLNYGFEKVRFLAPVAAGASLVVRVGISAVEDKGAGRFLVRCTNSAFKANEPAVPVMVAESIAMVIT
jgi:acyl dehydratase